METAVPALSAACVCLGLAAAAFFVKALRLGRQLARLRAVARKQNAVITRQHRDLDALGQKAATVHGMIRRWNVNAEAPANQS
jgi:hypothetical protein